MTDFGLPDAMDTAKPLFNSIGVPGKIVVYNDITILEVYPFRKRIGSNEYI